jgi:alkylation response protein AidB-like acyl-CoA dehydrogenase
MGTATAVQGARRVSGGNFLVEDLRPEDIFTIEDLSPEQKQIAQVTADFAAERILPQANEIEIKNYDVTRKLMREAGELGLLGVDVPEDYGGIAMNKVTSALVGQQIGVNGSFSVTFGTHVTIGSLPLVWYGNAEQKQKYLPRLVTGELIAAYGLSEASAGSDAMNIRTRAVLSPDGEHYILNGEKMWISNAGFADLFTVFAKIDGEKFSAFLVEKGTPGFTVGKEEHKLGIRGSSTCPLIFSDCKIPFGNLLGEAGKGHHIAFNILNVGRYKITTGAVGGAQGTLRYAVRYAKGRVAFGKSISEFGLVQQKIAESAAAIYAAESMSYRVVGAIDVALAELDSKSPTYTQDVQKRIEEFALECSIMKFYGSEMLERVVDHALQIHGGYGYVEDYPIERIYRDSRINKIFEGTNEINRLITTNWMMKLALQGSLALQPAVEKVIAEAMGGAAADGVYSGPMAHEHDLLARTKKIALFCTGIATQRFGKALGEQQEVMGAIADILAELLAFESCILRAEKIGGGADSLPVKLTQYYAARSFRIVQTFAEQVISAVAEGEMLRQQMVAFGRFSRHVPANTVSIGREISDRMVEAGAYKL